MEFSTFHDLEGVPCSRVHCLPWNSPRAGRSLAVVGMVVFSLVGALVWGCLGGWPGFLIRVVRGGGVTGWRRCRRASPRRGDRGRSRDRGQDERDPGVSPVARPTLRCRCRRIGLHHGRVAHPARDRPLPGRRPPRALPGHGQSHQPGLAAQLRALPWKRVPVLRRSAGRGHGREEVRFV
jgi:hypothetical protein